jgi:hypothetical protein
MATLGMGRMDADFHCRGTTDEDSDRFIMSAIEAAKNDAPIRRNHAGLLLSPVAVGRSVSSRWKTIHCEMCVNECQLVVCSRFDTRSSVVGVVWNGCIMIAQSFIRYCTICTATTIHPAAPSEQTNLRPKRPCISQHINAAQLSVVELLNGYANLIQTSASASSMRFGCTSLFFARPFANNGDGSVYSIVHYRPTLRGRRIFSSVSAVGLRIEQKQSRMSKNLKLTDRRHLYFLSAPVLMNKYFLSC